MSENNDRFLRLPDVLDRTALSRSVVYRLVKQDAFPQRIKIGSTAVWSELAINQWMDEQKQAVQPMGGAS